MKKITNIVISVIVLAIIAPNLKAGNEQRAGEAGASELLINPWACASGFGNANSSSIMGFEASFLNVAGTAFTNDLEIGFTYTDYLVGSGIGINAAGLSKRVGESSVITGSVVFVDFGDLQQTLVESPDGDGATFTPTYSIISLSYAREFSNSIYGGATVKIINEGISNMKASGVAIDAGIQYLAGDRDQFRFGMTMQNVGPTMQYKGDGLTFSGTTPNGTIQTISYQERPFELPSLVRIGLSYDFFLAEGHNLLAAFNFTSNSFTKDQYHLGFEYGFKEYFQVRGGWIFDGNPFEENPFDFESTERATAFTGPNCGASVKLPINKEAGKYFAIDYSYRATNPFDGVHSVGARIIL